jgi:SNF2 family DNA or RNA helicase
VEQQAIDRVYRIGQDKNVFAYRMICKDTIEEKIIKLQQSKMSLSEELISEDDGFVKNLSENDLEFLFE